MSQAAGPTSRFERQLLLPDFGPDALARLGQARVHVVGAGPLATPALLYLARAGVDSLHLDDGGDVEPWEAGAWLYPPGLVGRPRSLAALAALLDACPTLSVRPHATDTMPTATLVCSSSEAVSRTASERARQAGLPQVVVLGDGEEGEVVTIPTGAPCFGCAVGAGARTTSRGGAAAALGALGALELLLLLARLVPSQGAGRRVRLAGGMPSVEPTVRRAGCACHLVY
jgi:hypothetical protein